MFTTSNDVPQQQLELKKISPKNECGGITELVLSDNDTCYRVRQGFQVSASATSVLTTFVVIEPFTRHHSPHRHNHQRTSQGNQLLPIHGYLLTYLSSNIGCGHSELTQS
jgi:hypothetical protein